ncbi:MAG: non-canonical purine NTP pyrophosphatase, partial [Nanoarchaeota archaeon]
MTNFITVGRPSYFGSRKEEILNNYDKVYGKDNWQIVHHVNGKSLELHKALQFYEDAYFEHFKSHRDDLDWIANNYENVYDNNVSNVNSGLFYAVQENNSNHFQDITIRRVLMRNGVWFNGKGLLEIRTNSPGNKWSPSNIQFHQPELIQQPELKGWWNPGSIESWYQSNKYLEVKDYDLDCRFKGNEITFVTSNNGKFVSATNALRNVVRLAKFELDIKEEQNSVEKIASHKARVAYSVLCKPVICDDSGFVIEKLNGYPGHHVGRELKSKGLEYFLELARQHGPLDSYWPMTVSYMDETLDKPKLFTSCVKGKLIGEARGDPKNPNLKSQLGLAFIVEGQTKTIAEMTTEEYDKYARSDRWGELAEFLKGRK